MNIFVVGEVGTRRESEVGTAVDNIIIEAHTGIQISFGVLHQGVDAGADKLFIPMVEPSRIELGDKVRSLPVIIGVHRLLEVVDIVFAVGAWQHSLDGTAIEEPVAVGRELRGVKTFLFEHLQHGIAVLSMLFLTDILLLCNVGAELILNLHEDDGTAMSHLQVLHLSGQLTEIDAAGIEERLVVGSHLHALDILQPPGKAAVVPFCAHVRPWAKDDQQSLFLSLAHEQAQVVIVRSPVPHAGSRLMVIPHHIGGYSVHPHGFNHLEAMAPVGCRHS